MTSYPVSIYFTLIHVGNTGVGANIYRHILTLILNEYDIGGAEYKLLYLLYFNIIIKYFTLGDETFAIISRHHLYNSVAEYLGLYVAL